MDGGAKVKRGDGGVWFGSGMGEVVWLSFGYRLIKYFFFVPHCVQNAKMLEYETDKKFHLPGLEIFLEFTHSTR